MRCSRETPKTGRWTLKSARRWRKRLPLWTASFLLGAALRWWLGDERLLVALLGVSLLAALFHALGLGAARRVERGSLNHLWNTARGMVVFALLPTAWQALKAVFGQPNTYSIQSLALTAAIIGVVWLFFGVLPRTWGGRTSRRGTRRHRRARAAR